MNEPPDYVKARGTDLAAQRNNRFVFVQRLRANPWRAIVLSGVFAALGVGLLLVPHRARAPVGVLATLAFAVAFGVLVVTLRRR